MRDEEEDWTDEDLDDESEFEDDFDDDDYDPEFEERLASDELLPESKAEFLSHKRFARMLQETFGAEHLSEEFLDKTFYLLCEAVDLVV